MGAAAQPVSSNKQQNRRGRRGVMLEAVDFEASTISDSRAGRRAACHVRVFTGKFPHRHGPLPMPFFALGISHLTAPVAIRERLSFAPGQIPDSLRALTALPGVHEAVILSTCNRT